MKRIPLVIALFAAFFLISCVFEARSRGIGFAPPSTDWELRQAWWQFDFLADCGVWVLKPSFYVLALMVRFSENEVFAGTAFCLSQLFTVLFPSLTVFYVTRVALRRRRA
jgi:hypothetical protein